MFLEFYFIRRNHSKMKKEKNLKAENQSFNESNIKIKIKKDKYYRRLNL